MMGIPVRILADRGPLLRAALAACANLESTAGAGSPAPLTIRLETSVAPAAAPDDSHCEVRVEGSRLRLDGVGIQGEADAARREAWATVPTGLIDDPARLEEVLDTLALFLLTRSGRIPLHAASIVFGDTAILLAGSSGSGKSTLALTADRAGIPVLSEDTVYLQLEPHFRIWGSPRPVHLLPDDLPIEGRSAAPDDAPLRHRNGRWKVALPVGTGTRTGRSAGRAVLCLLERGEQVALRPLDPARAVERVMSTLDPGFDHFRTELPAALEAVTAGGAWTLTLATASNRRNPDGPRTAITLLQRQFAR